jgi:hypothetical protein
LVHFFSIPACDWAGLMLYHWCFTAGLAKDCRRQKKNGAGFRAEPAIITRDFGPYNSYVPKSKARVEKITAA